jgi:hypothetical protein
MNKGQYVPSTEPVPIEPDVPIGAQARSLHLRRLFCVHSSSSQRLLVRHRVDHILWKPLSQQPGSLRQGALLACIAGICWIASGSASAQALVGMSVTPHRPSPALRWRRPAMVEPAARVELFVANDTEAPLTLSREAGLSFDGTSAESLITDGRWAWHDTPAAWLEEQVAVPAGGLAVLAFNGKSAAWAVGSGHTLSIAGGEPQAFAIDAPEVWLEKVIFLRPQRESESGVRAPTLQPTEIVVHLRNSRATAVWPVRADLWLPAEQGLHQVFVPAKSFNLSVGGDAAGPGSSASRVQRFPADGAILPGKAGVVVIESDPLPLGYAVLEIVLEHEQGGRESVAARVRIRPEAFDISGGWVASKLKNGNSLTSLPYLKTLRRMHINTGQIEEVGGYTDNPDLYAAYPLKRFNKLADIDRYDTDAMLPVIHAVEFIGEPQYGGGRPVPPQEVWELLAAYQPTRLPTSVTFSEERNWCHYAGLSDFAHYDAYRVIAPAADNWRAYDRWGGESIRWGAPLETIGDMTRSLAHHWRPAPIAIWSQGAHDGWGSRWSPRRASPTPDELRSQAWHGLGNGVASLYWFNLSVKSLVAFPDLIEPITRVNREAKMLEELLLRSALTAHERIDENNAPSWDLTVLAGPKAAVLTAHDLAYRIDAEQNVFQFQPRDGEFAFELPRWLAEAKDVFRIDADGVHDVTAAVKDGRAMVTDTVQVVGVYVATSDPELRGRLAERCRQLAEIEDAIDFNPAGSADDLAVLKAVAAEAD